MRIALPMSIVSPWSIEVALRLTELGNEVHVIDFHFPHKTSNGYLKTIETIPSATHLAKKVKMHFIKTVINHKTRYIIYAHKLKKLFHQYKIESVLVLSAGGFAAMTYLTGFKPFTIYTTGSDVLLSDGFTRLITKHILRSANAIIANGRYLAEKTEEMCGRRDIASLYMGVDTERFAPAKENVGNIQIIAPRGFLPIYNNEYLIQALALLPESLPLERVVFPSSGPDLARVKLLADQILPSHMKARVSFYGGVSDENMMHSLRESSIYVSLSRSDGTSISTLEALAGGLFPVLSDIPQNREWIESSKLNGILVPFDQPHVLASALQCAILDGAMRKKAKSINRAMILERADGRQNMAFLSRRLEDILLTYKKKATDRYR